MSACLDLRLGGRAVECAGCQLCLLAVQGCDYDPTRSTCGQVVQCCVWAQQPRLAADCGCMGCKMSFLCKLRFLSRNQREQLYIAEVESFLRVVKADGATKRMAVCKLFKAS